MHVDKQRAVRSQWRIPEATLLSIAMLGGSIGAWLGMYVFRHKTKKKKFFIGIPVILLIQVLFVLYILINTTPRIG